MRSFDTLLQLILSYTRLTIVETAQNIRYHGEVQVTLIIRILTCMLILSLFLSKISEISCLNVSQTYDK